MRKSAPGHLNRRDVLKLVARATGLAALPGGLHAESTSTPVTPRASEWSNWSGSQVAHPRAWLVPKDEAELIRQLKNAEGSIRVTGASTHGTGITLGSFSSMVRGARIVTPQGEIIECSPTRNSDILYAVSTSLGALGVVTQMTLQNRNACMKSWKPCVQRK